MVFILEKANPSSFKLVIWHFEDTEYCMSNDRLIAVDSSWCWKISIHSLRGYPVSASGFPWREKIASRGSGIEAEYFPQTVLFSYAWPWCLYDKWELGRFRRAFSYGLLLLDVIQHKIKTVWSGITVGPCFLSEHPSGLEVQTEDTLKMSLVHEMPCDFLSEWVLIFFIWATCPNERQLRKQGCTVIPEEPRCSEGGSGGSHTI